MIKTRRVLAAVAVVASLAGAGCGSSNATKGAANGSGTTSSNTPSAASSNNLTAAELAYAANFTGLTQGRADPAKNPIVLGWINQEGSVVSFPEATHAADAAVKFLNDNLGGIDGHPVQLSECFVQDDATAQSCATRMANDARIQIVLAGDLGSNGPPVNSVLAGKKPIVLAVPASPADFATKGVYGITPGTPGLVNGIVHVLATQPNAPKSIALLTGDNPPGHAIASQLLAPALARAGLPAAKNVFFPDPATGPGVASALQAAGGQNAQAVLPIGPISECIGSYEALQSLNVKPSIVVAPGSCYAPAMVQRLNGSLPNDWYFVGYGYNPFIGPVASNPNSQTMDMTVKEIHLYEGPNVDLSGFAVPSFGEVVLTAALLHKMGNESVAPASFQTTIEAYHGPVWAGAGNLECGTVPVFSSLCATYIGVEQFSNGKWVSIADGYNNKAVNAFSPS
jgi:branched-chain amino acid transport system substrate-binding protein